VVVDRENTRASDSFGAPATCSKGVTFTAPDWLSKSSDTRYSFHFGAHIGRVATGGLKPYGNEGKDEG